MAISRNHAILFVRPFDADTSAVNAATGRHGFGHVALWSGFVEDGEPIVLDSSTSYPGNPGGVQFRPMTAMTRGVPVVHLWLDDHLGQLMLRKAIRCIGAPYDYGGLLRPRRRDDAFTCSGLICCALPLHLDRRCRPRGPLPVSPNDIARGLGVPRWSP